MSEYFWNFYIYVPFGIVGLIFRAESYNQSVSIFLNCYDLDLYGVMLVFFFCFLVVLLHASCVKYMHWWGWRTVLILYISNFSASTHILICCVQQSDASMFPCFFTTDSYTYMFSYIESCYFVCFRVLLIMMLFYALWDLYLQSSCLRSYIFLLLCTDCLWYVWYIFMLRVYHVSQILCIDRHGEVSGTPLDKLVATTVYWLLKYIDFSR
jgi:hypothetical protein